MSSLADLLEDGRRQLAICNACRYCEGYCAVFPAMERRRDLADSDLVYLANLCFECRSCYYACPYTAPHAFDVNVPKLLAGLRVETYRRYAWPRVRSGATTSARLALACTVGIPLLALALLGTAALSHTHTEVGAFYAVVPYAAMVVPAIALLGFGLAVLAVGAVRFGRATGTPLAPGALWRATGDALRLTYLQGGGDGCAYPDAPPSHARRRLHHLVFYGFGLAFAATVVAMGYHHLLGIVAPYAIWSAPVALGTAGGLAMLAGSAGLLWLKWRSDRVPAEPEMMRLDVVFHALLAAVNATGLALLALRETAAMGSLLVVHLGLVAGLFVTLPYGKLAHVAYRYVALVRNAVESDSPSAHLG